MTYFESEKLKQIIALSGIVILGSFILLSLTSFIPALLGAIIFYIICSPLMYYLHVKKNMKKGLAIFIVIHLSFLVIIVPVFSMTNLLISKLGQLLSNSTDVFFKAHNANIYIKEHFGFNILSPENIVKAQEKITNIIPNLLNQTFTIIADIAIMYFILFYLLYTEHHLKNIIISYFPYKKENTELFVKELVSQTYSNEIGVPLLMIVQGVFSIIAFYIFGLQEPIFWGIMSGFLSFIPFIGTAIIWLPAGLVQLS